MSRRSGITGSSVGGFAVAFARKAAGWVVGRSEAERGRARVGGACGGRDYLGGNATGNGYSLGCNVVAPVYVAGAVGGRARNGGVGGALLRRTKVCCCQ